jgi:hypothetical protein
MFLIAMASKARGVVSLRPTGGLGMISKLVTVLLLSVEVPTQSEPVSTTNNNYILSSRQYLIGISSPYNDFVCCVKRSLLEPLLCFQFLLGKFCLS